MNIVTLAAKLQREETQSFRKLWSGLLAVIASKSASPGKPVKQ
ncbi:MAG TPA: hypothetical protein PLI90_04315 [Rhodocyclaceae bacterium]|nr:hypothetical protein [Rhodocyclaceae bacterium]